MENKTRRSKTLHLLHERGILLLVITSLTFAILGLAGVIETECGIFRYIELSILAVLWLDLIVRFFLSKEKERYLKENFMESIAILPVWKYLTLLHVLRIWEMLRVWERLESVKSVRVKKMKRSIDNTRSRVRAFTDTLGFIHVFHVAVYVLLISAFIVSGKTEISYSQALVTSAIDGFRTTASSLQLVVAIVLVAMFTVFLCMLIATIVVYRKRKKQKRLAENKAETAERVGQTEAE